MAARGAAPLSRPSLPLPPAAPPCLMPRCNGNDLAHKGGRWVTCIASQHGRGVGPACTQATHPPRPLHHHPYQPTSRHPLNCFGPVALAPQGCAPSGEEANGRCAMSACLSGLMQQAAGRVFALLAFSARGVLHGHDKARHVRLGIATPTHCQGPVETNNVNASSKAPSPVPHKKSCTRGPLWSHGWRAVSCRAGRALGFRFPGPVLVSFGCQGMWGAGLRPATPSTPPGRQALTRPVPGPRACAWGRPNLVSSLAGAPKRVFWVLRAFSASTRREESNDPRNS